MGIDTVVVYIQKPRFIRICASVPIIPGHEENEWSTIPYLVKELQLPLQELIPSLGSPMDEYNEAVSRLLPGESLDEGRISLQISSGLV